MRKSTKLQNCPTCGYATEHRILEKEANTGVPTQLRCLTCGTVAEPDKREKKQKVPKEKKQKAEEKVEEI
jgi:hypothetical protein